ncbi:MAG: dehydrogenase, partial [Verrucomicrobiota bacterium]
MAIVSLIVLAAKFAAAEELPPPPVLHPHQQLQTFAFAEPGYEIELAASEPMVQDPVAIEFDGQGRLWVVEMRGFMRDLDRTGEKEPIGRVSVLEDRNGDGEMDQSTVFLDGLVLPRAISIHPDGVLIAENKPLWFVQDLDGDLVADKKTLVDPDYAKDSIEHSANGLLRAMDNWIYNAKEGHRYRRVGDNWIREKTEKRGQWGICQDNEGALFYNYNHSQLHADFVPPNTLTRNPNHQPSTGLSVGLTQDNRVFPIRPTPAANRGYIEGVLDEQLRIKAFTSAGAPLVYRGHYGRLRNSAFVCEPVGNLIKRNTLLYTLPSISAEPTYDEKEFLASTDERFRPVWLANAPDGAIYIADMYRGIVQDGPHMTPYLREHHEKRGMEKPVHLGRIWRVTWKDFEPTPAPNFAKMSSGELIEQLKSPNGWNRDMAQMHLVENDKREAILQLRELALRHEEVVHGLHALWTLEGLRDPEPEKLLPALNRSPVIKVAAMRVLESLGVDLTDHITKNARFDQLDNVRIQMLLSVANLELEDEQRFELIAHLLGYHDALSRDAAMSGLEGKELAFLEYMLQHGPSPKEVINASYILENLSHAIVQSGDTGLVQQLLELLDQTEAWKNEAVFAGVALHAPTLIQKPMALPEEPSTASSFPRVSQFFSWPGHKPLIPTHAATRPLNEGEQKLLVRFAADDLSFNSTIGYEGPNLFRSQSAAPELAHTIPPPPGMTENGSY